MKRLLAPFAFLVLVPLLGVTSCASVFSEYCDKRANCIGGNDNDRAACADQLRGEEKYTCRNNTAVCNAGKFTTACDTQSNALDACTKLNSATK